ncbi:hypothetical protein [Halocalculus aciditolerans]|uniref:Uncharacterized protein n=1 Tax=Halocalculus aciditolerans TaxID=1383812 RepID=A0A830FCU7_9EURY|nr:hypothetical protein [Halocalculus aciditolerans]GGL62041.1 hypothetical protein GCM10009039_20300 [Halocalculus aciditolerans]
MNQARRRLLAGVGLTALAGVAGCTSARAGTPASVPETSFERSEDGRLLVRATVSNPSEAEEAVVLTVTADLGDRVLEESRDLTLDAHQTQVVEVVFDVAWEDASQDLSVSSTLRPA